MSGGSDSDLPTLGAWPTEDTAFSERDPAATTTNVSAFDSLGELPAGADDVAVELGTDTGRDTFTQSPTMWASDKKDADGPESVVPIQTVFAGVEATDVYTTTIPQEDLGFVTRAAIMRLDKLSTGTLLWRMRRYLHLPGPFKPNQLDSWSTFTHFMKFELYELWFLPVILLASFFVVLLRRLMVDAFYEELERIGWNTINSMSDGDQLGHGRQAMQWHIVFFYQLNSGLSISSMSWVTAIIPWFMVAGGRWMPKKWMWLFLLYPTFQFLWIFVGSFVMVEGYDVHVDLDLFSIPVFASIPFGWFLLAKGYSFAMGYNVIKHVLTISVAVIVTFFIYGYTIPPLYFTSSFNTQILLRVVLHPILIELLIAVCRVEALLMKQVPNDNAIVFIAFRLYWWTSMWGRYLVANAPTLELSVYLNIGLTVSELVMRVISSRIDYFILRCRKGDAEAGRIMSSPRAVRIYVDLLALDTFDELYGITVSAIIIWMFQWGNPIPGETVQVGLLLEQTFFAFGMEIVSIFVLPYCSAVLLGGGFCGERTFMRRMAVREMKCDLHAAKQLKEEAGDLQGGDSESESSSRQLSESMQPMYSKRTRSPRATMKDHDVASYVGVHRVTGEPVFGPIIHHLRDERELREKATRFLSTVRRMDVWEGHKRTFTNIINASYDRPKYYYLSLFLIITFSFDLFVRQFFNPVTTTCVSRLNDQNLWYATYQYHFCPPQSFFQ